RYRVDRILGSGRLTGLNPADKTLAKHTDRKEFHRFGKLVTAAPAGALALRAHCPNRPSAKSNSRLDRVVSNRSALALANCRTVSQAIARYVILTRQMTFSEDN